MKIGLSYSRCIRDIVDARVCIDDILVIISRTNFDPRNDDHWLSIWNGYRDRNGFSVPEWYSYEEKDQDLFRSISIDLYETGKLHQPRQFGWNPSRLPYYWLETVLIAEDLDKNPAVKSAWDNFQLLAGLSNCNVEHNHR